MARLADRYMLLAPDLRGFGDSGSQVSQNSGQPCTSSSGGPLPVRATWNAAPLARTVKCSIGLLAFFFSRATVSWTPGEFCPAAPCLASDPRLELAPTEGQILLRYGAWRGGRVVECTALEMRHRCKPIGGSNPSLSATTLFSFVSDCSILQVKQRVARRRMLRLVPRCYP